MGAVEDVRKIVQDFIAPELRAITVKVDHLAAGLPAMEERLLEAIKQAKTEILLTTQLASMAQQNAELIRQVNKLQEERQSH